MRRVPVHGTLSMYNGRKCRCPACLAARSEKSRTESAVEQPRKSSEYLATLCWCERITIMVHRDEVLACRTVSCGDEGCREAA